MIQPQPLPFQAIVQTGRTSEGKDVVILNLITVTGATVVFLPPDGAESLATDLTRGAKTARTGLILPGRDQHPQGPR